MVILFAAAFGLIIGSFLNVCIYRIPRDKSIVWPGSGCPACSAPIRWYDNIPVLSFLILRGKCRKCGNPISWRYPLVESLTAMLTIIFSIAYGGWWLVFILPAVYALLVLSFIDIDFFIIPDTLSVGLTVLGLVSFWANPNFEGPILSRFYQSLGGAALGFGLLWFIAFAGEKIFRKEAMGGGDIKLMAGVGAIIGWQGVISTLMIGSFFGSLYGIYMIISKKVERQDPIPFGPFLSMGALLNFYHFIPLSAFLWYY